MINPNIPDYHNTPVAPERPRFDFVPADVSGTPVMTIVTPFFNAGTIFHETAESVFRQSLQNWEWLIINDGSTDAEALRLLEQFRNKDPRVRVVDHPRNEGLSAARNTGFKEARTEFVFQLDADDLIEPTTLEKMVWHLRTHPNSAFVTGFTVGFGSMQYLWRNGFHSGKRFLDENLVTATCLVRRSIHQAVGGYSESIRGGLEDWDFWLKAAATGHWGTTIPEFFDWYRRRDAGREHWDNLLEKEKSDKFRARLRQRYAPLWEKFPRVENTRPQLATPVSDELPFRNRLRKAKRRLLLIVPHFELGGADKFNLDLIAQLQKQHGFEVTVVATRKAQQVWQHEFEQLTPDVFALSNFLHYTDHPLFLRYLIDSRQPDFVCIANSHLGYQLVPYLRSYFPDVPFVDYLHMEQEDWMSGGYPRCSIIYQSQLAQTIVSSQHLKNWMTARGGDESRIRVCHTNIDAERWCRDHLDAASMRKKWNLPEATPVILYAGRICDQKQPRVFADTLRRLAKNNASFVAVVAGDGPDLPWLKEFAQREQLTQIRFLGAVSGDSIRELLSVSDIFFLPSRWEGISLALFEAMSMEVVPVGADVGGQKELVTANCGVLITRGPHEASDYAQALQKLLSSSDRRKAMARASRQRIVEKFALSAMGDSMFAAFEAAQAELTGSKLDRPMSRLAGGLHATEVIELTRITEYSDGLHRQHSQFLARMKPSIEWQAAVRSAQALNEANQKSAAIHALEEGIRVAAASKITELEITARIEIAEVMVSLDHGRAITILSEASFLAERLPDSNAGRELADKLKKLTALMKSKAPVASTTAVVPAGEAPLVSVVIPCFRQAQYLPDAVASVVAQTFTNWELFIVNDGSPDNTSTVAATLIAKYPTHRIRLIEKSNGGLPSARNAGVREARGKYMLPLDADDQIRPAFLERLVPILENNSRVGFAYSHIQHFGQVQSEFPLPDFDRETLIHKDNIACVCALFRKSVWEQVGGYNEAMREGYEDWDFWIGCVEHGWDGYCLHEPLFLYRKSGGSMLQDANKKRERLIAQIVCNHPMLYAKPMVERAKQVLQRHAEGTRTSSSAPVQSVPATAAANLRITYLISSIQGVTGGNQTLLRQAEDMHQRGHEVSIVTYTPKPAWFQFHTRVIVVPAGQPMAGFVPPSDVVVSTYFSNTHELRAIKAKVKVYYAQGDQFIFGDATMANTDQNRRLREMSRSSYLTPGIRFVPNSNNLANAVEKLCGRKPDAILPVCTDQHIFRPLQRSVPGSRIRLLVVGPDARGSEAEPLLFKGIQDIHDALLLLAQRFSNFTVVRMSSTRPEIFSRFPCEFYIAPADEMKTVLFGTSNILIYASHYDSCPRPPQEAMAAGCAVVCTATPGAMEYCRNGENSLLVPIQSPAAIADAVESLIKDPALREKLIQGGLATAREYPREREWDEWDAMLRRFVNESQTNSLTSGTLPKPKPLEVTPKELPHCAQIGNLTVAREAFGQKDFSAAWKSAIAAVKSRPFHPEAFLLLAEIAHAAGDGNSAKKLAQHARDRAPGWKAAKQFLQRPLKGNATPDWLKTEDISRLTQHEIRISVCVITKNEERFIDQCLKSIKSIAYQIVVVDTGSTDRTVEIAKSLGAEVHAFAWCDDFSAARNAALEHATGDWILMLDADEELPADQHENLLKDIRKNSAIAYRLPLVNEGQNDGRSFVPRLFRNAPGAHFYGRIHEQVFPSLIPFCKPWGMETLLGTAQLLHHGYTKELVKDRNKIERNLRLLKQAVIERPNDPNLIMNFGLELVRSGELVQGLEKYREAFQLMSAQSPADVVPELREVLLTQLTVHLYKDRRHDEIIRVLTSPLARNGGLTASLHFALGLALFESKQPREAAEQMRQCVVKRNQPALSPINTDILTAAPNHCLALSLAQSGDAAGAKKAFETALTESGKLENVKFDFAKLLASQNEPVEALHKLHEVVAQDPTHLNAWKLGAEIALKQREFLEFACDWTSEAIRALPNDPTIIAFRAEALLLSQQTEHARPLWEKACNCVRPPNALAAFILCSAVESQPIPETRNADEELAASKAFVGWYQRLVNAGAKETVVRLNSRVDALRASLPTAARLLDSALAEAK